MLKSECTHKTLYVHILRKTIHIQSTVFLFTVLYTYTNETRERNKICFVFKCLNINEHVNKTRKVNRMQK